MRIGVEEHGRAWTDVVGVLNSFSVGERIGKGNSQLDHVSSARFHREHHRDSTRDRGITSREESNENWFILIEKKVNLAGFHERGSDYVRAQPWRRRYWRDERPS